jgi:hypothetical protein
MLCDHASWAGSANVRTRTRHEFESLSTMAAMRRIADVELGHHLGSRQSGN